jgi:hypothetical protein
MKKITLVIMIGILFAKMSSSQTELSNWALLPNIINFELSVPQVTPIPNAYNWIYNASNGAFDENSNLLFYLRDRAIYDAQGNFIDDLEADYIIGTIEYEISIVPVPEIENKYYIVYLTYGLPVGHHLYYSVIDCSNGNIQIEQNGVLLDTYYGSSGGIAVSALQSNNTRHLYCVASPAVNKYVINETGIFFDQEIYTGNVNSGDMDYETPNLELSFDESKLAWSSNVTSIINVISLNENGNFAELNLYTIPNTTGVAPQISGIEFSPDGTKIFASVWMADFSGTYELIDGEYPTSKIRVMDNYWAIGGLFAVNLQNSEVTQLTNDGAYHTSHLEIATDGYIYAVGNDGDNLGRLDPVTNSFVSNAVSVNVYSNNEVAFYLPFYSLPDQIDYKDVITRSTYETCAGAYDATTTVVGSFFGTAPYSFQWNDPAQQTTATATGLTQGEYTVVITDNFDNSRTVIVKVKTDPALFNYTSEMVITQNTNWDNVDYKINGYLELQNNSTLTINGNSNLQFSSKSGIIVYPGSQLIINGKLSISGLTACNNTFDGIIVKSGGNLFLHQSSKIVLSNDAIIEIAENSNFTIENNSSITGTSPNSVVAVYGTIIIGTNVNFTSANSINWEGLFVKNMVFDLPINSVNFENCNLSGESKSLDIRNSTFNNSTINYQKGNVTLYNTQCVATQFNTSFGGSKSASVEITDCSFRDYTGSRGAAIYIETYPLFKIENCTIENNNCDGINLYNSGTSFYQQRIVRDNTIRNNGSTGHNTGLKIYHSYVDVKNNFITENPYGLVCLRNSNVTLIGNDQASNETETQRIIYNTECQVFATDKSFPYEFRWNVIYSQTEPYVYNSRDESNTLDVRYNNWGESFSPETALYPAEFYIYEPIWYFNNETPETRDGELLFKSAQSEISQQNYSVAKNNLKQVVSQYSEADFAQTSLKELLVLEDISDNDYTNLINYFQTETNIQSNEDLLKLSEYLTNYCNLKLENFNEAVNFLEYEIENPEYYEDSVFAAIDLGYIFILTGDTSLFKSTFACSHTNLIPKSKIEFEASRTSFINKVLKMESNSSLTEESLNSEIAGLYSNYPNPFTDRTQIKYFLKNKADVTIKIFDITGKEIKSFVNNDQKAGTYYINYKPVNQTNAFYYYSLFVNGKLIDSKKMIMLK